MTLQFSIGQMTGKKLKVNAEADFKIIKDWFTHNKLTLNTGKTKYLPFTSYTSSLPDKDPLCINQITQIPETDSIKFLGRVID